jgi:poly(A) polymerase
VAATADLSKFTSFLAETSSDSGRLFRAAGRVVTKLRTAGFQAVFVGGAVRDLLMGADIREVDITSSATPEQVQALFERTVPVGESFGVVCVLAEGFQFEVATFRCEEGYSDGRRPDTVRPGTLQEDVLRRDFTVNGLVLDPFTGVVTDYVGGLADLAARKLRAIGVPGERMQEDYLRTLRAVRFASVLKFAMDPDTRLAIGAAADGLRRISRERVRAELEKLCAGLAAVRGLRLIHEVGLAPYVFPFDAPVTENVVREASAMLSTLARPASLPVFLGVLALAAEPKLIFKALNRGEVELRTGEMARLFRLSNADRKRLDELLGLPSRLLALEDSRRLARKVELFRSPYFEEAVAFTSEYLSRRGADTAFLWDLQIEFEAFPQDRLDPPLPLDGNDLTRLGVPQGPLVGDMLRDLHDLVVERQVLDRDGAIAWVLSRLEEVTLTD